MGFGLGRKDEAASAPSTPHGHESKWTKRAMGLSDKLGGAVNSYGQKWGLEAFWPTTGDFSAEMEKAAKILRSFTIEAPTADAGHHSHKYAKIPPSVVRDAKGIAIYTCVRAGVAPWGGAGGSGLVVARLPDGSWSAPAAIMPTSMTAGLQIGLDVYDAVLIIRTEEALRQFGSHRFSLGADVSVAAGPRGAGQGAEGSFGGKKERDHDGKVDKHAQVYSYMRSKGVYAGIEVVGTAFISRADENEAMYHQSGIKPVDILSGRVPSPPAARDLNLALQAAETGYAQAPGFAQYGPNDTAATVSGGAPPLPPRQVEHFSKPNAMDYKADSKGGYSAAGNGGGGAGFAGAAAAYNAGAFNHGGSKGNGAYGQQSSGAYGQSSAYGQGSAYGQQPQHQPQSGFAPPGGFAPPPGPPPTRFVAPSGPSPTSGTSGAPPPPVGAPPPPAGPPPAYHE